MSGIFKKKGTFGDVLPRNMLTLFSEKRALFCQILQRAASNYQTLISSGLFPVVSAASSQTILSIDRSEPRLKSHTGGKKEE